MTRRARRCLSIGTAAVVLCGLLCVLVPPKRARAFFGDEVLLSQILGQNIATYVQVVKMMANTMRQVQQLNTMLQRLEGGDVLGTINRVSRSARMAAMLDRDVKLIGHKLELVDTEQKAVYQKSFKDVPPAEFHAKASGWNDALHESTEAAMRAQTNVSTLQERAEAQQALLQKSGSAQGIVEQLQLILQSLAILHTDLEALQRTLDTGERVASNLAAGKASDFRLVEEQHRLSLENYTNAGPPVVVTDELP